ncbi:MAG TPA: hypothetical protein DDW50_06965 [Firmicutes bacterium]|nr:hypothetical protein [Bacillota bacterium]
MKIAVIDGQGGGIGKLIVEKLRKELPGDTEIIALGTNSLATSGMIKAGANEGATGENAIIYNACRVDTIIGPLGIIAANSMLGELTPLMARAIAESPARKVLLPLNRCNIKIAGMDKNVSFPHLLETTIQTLKNKES